MSETDPPAARGQPSGKVGLAEELEQARRECEGLRIQHHKAQQRVDELATRLAEARRDAAVNGQGATPVARPERSSSAWDRAVQAMRRKPGELPPLARAHSDRPMPPAAKPGPLKPEPAKPESVNPPPAKLPPAKPAPAPAVARRLTESSRPAPVAWPMLQDKRVPPPPPAVPARQEQRPKPGPVEGPCLLHALDRDTQLTHGQKETVRSVYQRFVAPELLPTEPQADGHVSIEQGIDLDPRLSRGQREALRTMVRSFAPKRP
jgi:hypothetical protein